MQPLEVGCFGLLQKAYQRGLSDNPRGLRKPRWTSANLTAIVAKVILDGLLILTEQA